MSTSSIDIDGLQQKLCDGFCADVKVSRKNDVLLRVETPFYFADGDPYQLYLRPTGNGGFRVTDMGHTLMHLSYENDIDSFRKGTSASVLEQIKLEFAIGEYDGEFYVESSADEIHLNIFKLGQAITKICDLTFFNQTDVKNTSVKNTFYDDLETRIHRIVAVEKIQKYYAHPKLKQADDYLIDYRIEGKENSPLFLFGVLDKNKARLTTIILEHLIRYELKFQSLIVFQEVNAISKDDFRRLHNVSKEIVPSLDAEQELTEKLYRFAA